MAAQTSAADADPRTIFSEATAIKSGATFDASKLTGKSVVITGGASGIGEAALRAFVAAGAFVTFGDVADDRGEALQSELGPDKVAFVHCDVLAWKDQVALFKTAIAKSPEKSLDVVFANAGIAVKDDLLATEVDADGDPVEPQLATLKVNLIGMTYTAKLAMHYFAQQPEHENRDRCLVMTASIAGYLDQPNAPLYNSSKWGTRGLFRSLRNTMPSAGMRIGIIAPWFIRTRIIPDAMQERFEAAKLEYALPEDAAAATLHIAADKSINGRSLAIVPRSDDPRGYMDLQNVDNVKYGVYDGWKYNAGLKQE